jgi:hypothetical protein
MLRAMEDPMIPCSSCHRHLRAADAVCPFCSRPSAITHVMQALGGAVTTVVLAACYGGADWGKYDTADSGDGTGDTGMTTTDPTTDDTGSATDTSAATETGGDTGATATETGDTGLSTSTGTSTDDTAIFTVDDSGDTTTSTTGTDSGLPN